jgi:hypothetical protein
MTEKKVSDVFLITKEFHTSTEFSQYIEKMAYNTSSPCMDMVVDYCIKKEIEIESMSKYLTSSLKEKIKNEALDLNLLKEKRQTEKLL